MKLNYDGILNQKEEWERDSYELPSFDIKDMKIKTMENPIWIHFGINDISRGFLGEIQQKLLNNHKTNKGIIIADILNYKVIDLLSEYHDNLSILITKGKDGCLKKTIIASVAEYLKADSYYKDDFKKLKDIFKKDSLQIVTLTIDKEQYNLDKNKGELLKNIKEDFENGPENPKSYMGKISSLCYERFLIGKKKLALIGLDNYYDNEIMLYDAINQFANRWAEKGMVERKFIEYINDKNSIYFPCAFIDNLDFNISDEIKKSLKDDSIKNLDNIKNKEESLLINMKDNRELIIEDIFPNGRPLLEKAGVKFTSKEEVKKIKSINRNINDLVAIVIGIFGCLLSYDNVYDEMNDIELKTFIEKLEYDEYLNAIEESVIIQPKEFIDKALNDKIYNNNYNLYKKPEDLTINISQKMPYVLGKTIKSYVKNKNLDINSLKYMPLVISAWLRYLMEIDDYGKSFVISSDPIATKIKKYINNIEFGKSRLFTMELIPILSDKNIFGVNLYDVGLGKKVESYFEELVAGKGFVRKTLKRHLR